MYRVSRICTALILPCAFLVVGCDDGTDEALLGDTSFRITQECYDDGTCEPECEDTWCEVCEDSNPPSDGGCWITGIGHLIDATGRDNFGGNGMPMKAGYIRGEWEHQDHDTGDKLHGRVEYLVCRRIADEPGPDVPKAIPNQAYYGGPGRWYEPGIGWQDGYWFDIMAEDHGEPGKLDEYYFSVRRMDASGQVSAVIYSAGGVLAGGNFQIHPPNAGHPFLDSELPAWVSLQP